MGASFSYQARACGTGCQGSPALKASRSWMLSESKAEESALEVRSWKVGAPFRLATTRPRRPVISATAEGPPSLWMICHSNRRAPA